jgi:hypothetical protein
MVAGFIITFPVIYIPVINITVFKHRAIGYLICYVTFVEMWKAIKHRCGLWSGERKTLSTQEGI